MSFPGFSAEVSLYVSPRHYCSASKPRSDITTLNPGVTFLIGTASSV